MKRNVLGVIGGYIGFFLSLLFLAIVVGLLASSNLNISILYMPPITNAFCSLISGIIVGYITQKWKYIIIVAIFLTVTWILISTHWDSFMKNPQWYLLNLHPLIVFSIIPFSVFGGYIGKKIGKRKRVVSTSVVKI